MYGKLFKQAYSGSLVGSGLHVFGVWNYVIAHTWHSYVEINPKVVATILGCTEDEVKRGIEYLESPDPDSRCKDYDGKRLVRQEDDPFSYFVPTHEKYRSIRNDDERREYNRQKKREERAKHASQKNIDMSMTVNDVNDSQHSSAHTETDTETEKELIPLAPLKG